MKGFDTETIERTVGEVIDCLMEKYSLTLKEANTIVYNEWEQIEEMIRCGFGARKLCKAIMRDLFEPEGVA
jgi:hypothetical protein